MKALATIALFLVCTFLALLVWNQIEARMIREEPVAQYPRLDSTQSPFTVSVDGRESRCKTFDIPGETQRCLLCVSTTKTQTGITCFERR